MESALPEWYDHDEKTLKKIITTGTIAFDTNVLLDLYRVGNGQRKQILQVLRDVRERIFIPYQVAYEFQRSRLGVAVETEKLYDRLLNAIKPSEELLNAIRDLDVRAEVVELFDGFTEPIQEGLKKLQKEHAISFDEVRKNDPIRKALDELLADESIGERPDKDTLRERKAVAKQRVDARIPPGFLDHKKPDPSGDYLIWAELLEHASASNRPLLFVTRDKKADWYREEIGGRDVGPLTELIAEMHEASPSHPYHQVELATFLWMAREFLDSEVEEATIETVRNISRPVLFDSETVANMYPRLNISTELQDAMRDAINAAYPGMTSGLIETLQRREREIGASLVLGPDFQQSIGASHVLGPDFQQSIGASLALRPDFQQSIGASLALRPDFQESIEEVLRRRDAQMLPGFISSQGVPTSQNESAPKAARKSVPKKTQPKKTPKRAAKDQDD